MKLKNGEDEESKINKISKQNKEIASSVNEVIVENLQDGNKVDMNILKVPEANVYDVHDELFKVRRRILNVRWFIWNMQTLNKDEENKTIKLTFLKNIIIEIFPEFIALIDVGKNINDINSPNYKIYNDTRNVFMVRNDICEEVEVEDSMFILKNLNTVICYVRPNEEKMNVVDKVKKYILSDWNVVGNINLATNKQIAKVINESKNYKVGENSDQTVWVTKRSNDIMAKNVGAPSDHKAIVIYEKRLINFRNNIKLEALNLMDVEQALENIFYKAKYTCKLKIRQVKVIDNDEVTKMTKQLVDSYINNDLGHIYKKFDKLWKVFKKEPFLGTYAPQSVIDTLKIHYANSDNKIYEDVDINLLEDIKNLYPKNPSHSKAITVEAIKLNDIDKALSKLWDVIESKSETKNVLKNFFTWYNKNKMCQRCKTFFLIKNRRLKTFHDVRIITIVPLSLKIWESLIYERVLFYLTEFIDNEGRYQLGARHGGFTFQTFFEVQKLVFEKKANGLISVDIEKGFDSIDWNIMQEDINKIEDKEIQSMLKIWTVLVENCDVICNTEIIKKGRGVGMGFTLSPITFVFYVDMAIRESKVNKDILRMYVDDLILLAFGEKTDIDNFERLKKSMERRNLKINNQKCKMITKHKRVKEIAKELQLQVVDADKYLGVHFGFGENNWLLVDARFAHFSKNMFCLPKFLNFAVRRIIVEGALVAKIRYTSMMSSIKLQTERYKIWSFLWKMYKPCFKMLSYLQLVLFSCNIFRWSVDLWDIYRWTRKYELCDKDIAIARIINEIKDNVSTGIKYLDKEIAKIDIKLSWDDLQVDLTSCKIISERVWIEFQEIAYNSWHVSKTKLGLNYKKYSLKFIQSKLCRSSIIIQDIVFKHYTSCNEDKFIFTSSIMNQLYIRKISNMQILQEFDKQTNNVFISHGKTISKLMALNYMNKLDEYLQPWVSDIEKEEISNDFVKIILKMEAVILSPAWYNASWTDMITALNLKLNTIDEIEQKTELILSIAEDGYDIIDKDPTDDIIFSVDGSFNNVTNMVGAGIILKKRNESPLSLCFKYEGPFINKRNIAGELLATIKAVIYAIGCNFNKFTIMFDYIGNYKYCYDNWKCEDIFTRNYKRAMLKLIEKYNLQIRFVKVKSHTNINLNDLADEAAKMGCDVLEKDDNIYELEEYYDLSQNVYNYVN